jgi:acetyltransferase-like isoleucine patch superfamily enzyme
MIERILKRFFKEVRYRRKKKWNRVLPIGDEISDRWEKAQFLGFGRGASIYDSSLVIGDVKVGENTWIGPFTVLDGSGGLEIGKNCSISSGVQIYSHETVEWALTGSDDEHPKEKTVIGDHCYIGPNVVVSMGVTVGHHCIIGANSVVMEDIEPYSMAVGSPCRIVNKIVIGEDGSVSKANE